MVMLDDNEEMRKKVLKDFFDSLYMKEAIFARHGTNAPATYRKNLKGTSIDGILVSPSISISVGGYFAFDECIMASDHHSL